jgi:hypothetical protein
MRFVHIGRILDAGLNSHMDKDCLGMISGKYDIPTLVQEWHLDNAIRKGFNCFQNAL